MKFYIFFLLVLLSSPIPVPASPLFFNTGNTALDLAIGGAAIGAGSGLVLGKARGLKEKFIIFTKLSARVPPVCYID